MSRVNILGAASAATIEGIVSEHGNLVYRLAYSMTGKHMDAEDVMQNVFRKLFRSWVQIGAVNNMRGWLTRMTTNAAIDLLKVRKRQGRNIDQEWAGDIDGNAAAPDHELQREEMYDKINEALDLLPPQQKAALVLFDREGLKGKEIGRMLGVSETTVRSYVFEARKKMRSYLQPFLQGRARS